MARRLGTTLPLVLLCAARRVLWPSGAVPLVLLRPEIRAALFRVLRLSGISGLLLQRLLRSARRRLSFVRLLTEPRRSSSRPAVALQRQGASHQSDDGSLASSFVHGAVSMRKCNCQKLLLTSRF